MIKGIYVTDTYTYVGGGKTYSGKFDELTRANFPDFSNVNDKEKSLLAIEILMFSTFMMRYDEKGNYGSTTASDRQQLFGLDWDRVSAEELDSAFFKKQETYKMDGNEITVYLRKTN